MDQVIEAVLNLNLNFVPGGSKVIQEAISKPSDPQIQEEAWDRMVPLITNLINLKESYTHLNQVRGTHQSDLVF